MILNNECANFYFLCCFLAACSQPLFLLKLLLLSQHTVGATATTAAWAL